MVAWKRSYSGGISRPFYFKQHILQKVAIRALIKGEKLRVLKRVVLIVSKPPVQERKVSLNGIPFFQKIQDKLLRIATSDMLQ